MPWRAELPLVGAGGEPVDLRRTLASHGVADLPPNRLAADVGVLETTVRLRSGPRTIRVSAADGHAVVEAAGPRDEALTAVRRLLRLDADLSPFYARVADDPNLAWAARGAGRLMRCQTVFEDVVKTICTTNCAWSATVRMVTALVEHLGEQAPRGARAFPTPAAMAEAPDDFYRDVVRAGYRGAYLRTLARSVAEGELDLDALDALPDDELHEALRALPGVGPYAAAHVAMIGYGRYGRLILDSWTQPTYARLAGRKASDKAIERRFRRYGPWQGLAFWLYLTRGWIDDGLSSDG